MRFFDLTKIDNNKMHTFIIQSRSNGKRYYLYKLRREYLNDIGIMIRRGFSDKIIPKNESMVNCTIVELMKMQEDFRKTFNLTP